jgi:hypothetical protein
MLALGAWRALPTFDGRTAADVARRRGHVHLLELLETPKPLAEPDHIAALGRRPDELVSQRAADIGVSTTSCDVCPPGTSRARSGTTEVVSHPGTNARADRDLTSVSCG